MKRRRTWSALSASSSSATAKSSIEIDAVALVVDEQAVLAGAVLARALARLEHRRRAHVGPVDVGRRRAVDVQRLGLGQRVGLPLLAEVVGVEDAHAGGDLEAAGAAQHDQARDARARESLEQGARRGRQRLGRLAEARADGADGEVVAAGDLGHAGGIGGVAGHDGQAVAVQVVGLRVAHDRGDLVPALERLGHRAGPDAAARAEDDDPHRLILIGAHSR